MSNSHKLENKYPCVLIISEYVNKSITLKTIFTELRSLFNITIWLNLLCLNIFKRHQLQSWSAWLITKIELIIYKTYLKLFYSIIWLSVHLIWHTCKFSIAIVIVIIITIFHGIIYLGTKPSPFCFLCFTC